MFASSWFKTGPAIRSPIAGDILPTSKSSSGSFYDQVANRYEKMHDRWLRYAGGEAQAALEATLLTTLRPGMKLLDAGCGTGALTRIVQAQFGTAVSTTMLDVSKSMLDQAADVEAKRVEGSLLQMPLDDSTFDLAVACWSIEASGDAPRAISELARVVRPNGHILLAFCAREPAGRWMGSLMRKTVELRGTGLFLDVQTIKQTFNRAGATRIVRHRCRGPVAVLDVQLI